MSEWDEAPERAVVDAWVAAPVDEVWDLWTTAEGLERWWWPMFDDARYEIDARVDGVYRIATATGGMAVQGRFLEVEPGARLVMTWDWLGGYEDGKRHVQVVTVELREHEGGTVVRAGQTAPLDEVETVREGWQDTLTRLEELVDED